MSLSKHTMIFDLEAVVNPTIPASMYMNTCEEETDVL